MALNNAVHLYILAESRKDRTPQGVVLGEGNVAPRKVRRNFFAVGSGADAETRKQVIRWDWGV